MNLVFWNTQNMNALELMRQDFRGLGGRAILQKSDLDHTGDIQYLVSLLAQVY